MDQGRKQRKKSRDQRERRIIAREVFWLVAISMRGISSPIDSYLHSKRSKKEEKYYSSTLW